MSALGSASRGVWNRRAATAVHGIMRIIAGEYGGRTIQAPPGIGTRPMLDRVREALFSTLGGRFDGARVLDLFAGSGSLGLECLSRGALLSRMVERDPATVRLLRANVELLGAGERARVVGSDALAPKAWREPGVERYTVIFLDPPYPLLRDGATRKRVLDAAQSLSAELLEPEGSIVLHAPRELLNATEFAGLEAVERAYGTSSLWYLTPPRARTEAS